MGINVVCGLDQQREPKVMREEIKCLAIPLT